MFKAVEYEEKIGFERYQNAKAFLDSRV